MTVKKRSDSAKLFAFTSWRDLTPMNVSVGNMLHNKTGSWRFIKPVYEDKIPACQNECPSGNDIEGWVKLVQAGDFQGAYWHLKREQPFPAILGRVCFKFCENACNRKAFDHGVRINELERFVGDQIAPETPHPDLPDYHDKTLAVVGSGPAGMACAYFARLLGFRVTIFEQLPEPGGILRVGIPSYRLPRQIVAREFAGLEKMGIVLQTSTQIGRDIDIDDLSRRFDYLFLATGVHAGVPSGLTGEKNNPHLMSGLDLLKRVALGEAVNPGTRVVVIGGGNTAIDAARTAVRSGTEVTVVYRRSEAEMPAHPQEVRDAVEEGVRFRFLAAPQSIAFNADQTIDRLVFCEMELGPPDQSGRPRPVKKQGATFELRADTIISAIGERADLSYLHGPAAPENGVIAVDAGQQMDTAARQGALLFAGGDITDSPHTVIHAIAAGKKAAIAMDCRRKGMDFSDVQKTITTGRGPALSFTAYMGWKKSNAPRQNLGLVVKSDKIVFDYFHKTLPVETTSEPAAIRKHTFDAYRASLSIADALYEASRCMHCGRCTACDNCLVFCPDMSVLASDNGGFGYAFDYDYCKGCGICSVECPRHAITMLTEETPIAQEEA